jgi:hypothetical protein
MRMLAKVPRIITWIVYRAARQSAVEFGATDLMLKFQIARRGEASLMLPAGEVGRYAYRQISPGGRAARCRWPVASRHRHTFKEIESDTGRKSSHNSTIESRRLLRSQSPPAIHP